MRFSATPKLANTVFPRLNSFALGSSPTGSAAEALASESVSDSVSVSGGVTETVDETFPLRCLKRFTRGVETSERYCLVSQLCGVINPLSSSSNPAPSNSCINLLTLLSCILSFIFRTETSGKRPLDAEKMHRILNQNLNCSSVSAISFGSSTASSYARHHRLMRSAPR